MPLRIGHRGAAGTHPENTMVSFRRALELGCDGVEFDIHRTKDGHLVVIHDAFLGRTTNGTGLIRDLTLADLEKLDAGTWKGSQFSGEKIPTLRQLIRETPKSLLLFLEMKAGSIHYPGIETDLLKLIREEGAKERVQISSFDHQGLQQLRELDPDIQLGMLYQENLLDPVGMARTIGANALHPNWEWVTPGLVQAAHTAGFQLNTWTVNLPQAIELVKYCKVDGIMSDFPDRI
ncbi:MAG TPA: glycerophosphodiester phosphodiesterase [Symbiobacteriaceae bacterium]|nr:glycerophosphodiester phosphodiesterase [Symbiobacteriaceae bacterium]